MKIDCIILYLLFLLSTLAGCTTDMEPEYIGQSTAQGKEAQAIFTLALPAQGLPSVTRAITNDSEIRNFTIWVFNGQGDNATFLKQVDAKDVVIREVNGNLQMFVLLPESDTPVTLSMIVNFSSSSSVAVGDTKKVALQKLTYSIKPEQPETMPMYGERELAKVKQGMEQTSITLRRAMAKIEVDIRKAYKQFELQEVKLLNINSGGYLYPASNVVESRFDYVQKISVTGKDDNIFTCYIPEILNVNNKDMRVSVLLKGIYRADGAVTFYRLDFISRDGQITNIARNYKYIFSIDNISASGYTKEQDAIEALEASNARNGEVEGDLMTITDEDIMDITTDGTNYLGVTSAQIVGGMNPEYYYANFSVVCNNTEKGWEMITDDFRDGVTVSLTSHIPTLANVETAVSVWIYIEKDKVNSGEVIDVFIYCGSIRKRIEVTIP